MLSIIGSALITIIAGNAAGVVTTYSVIGAHYGYSMLWAMLVIAIGLAVIQEMNARMAVVTGKGLSDLIRERYGVKWAFFAMVILLVASLGVCIGNFAGIAASLELFRMSKYISIPLVTIFIWFLLTKGNYLRTQNIFFLLVIPFISYVITAFIIKPDWSHVFTSIISPRATLDKGYFLMFIAMVGATITPYMQFYLQSSIVDNEIAMKEYSYEKLGIYTGTILKTLMTFFITICTAEILFKFGMNIETAQDAATALGPLASNYSFALFGIGLFGASLLACFIIPLSTAHAICEAFSFESGIDNKIKEAPVFFGLFLFMIVVSASTVLLLNISLVNIIIFTQQLAGVLCPIVLIFMIKLVNDAEVMGSYTNSTIQNLIVKLTVALLIVIIIISLGANFV